MVFRKLRSSLALRTVQEVLVGKDDSFSTSLIKSLYAGTDVCEQEPTVGTSKFSGTPLRHPQYRSL